MCAKFWHVRRSKTEQRCRRPLRVGRHRSWSTTAAWRRKHRSSLRCPRPVFRNMTSKGAVPASLQAHETMVSNTEPLSPYFFHRTMEHSKLLSAQMTITPRVETHEPEDGCLRFPAARRLVSQGHHSNAASHGCAEPLVDVQKKKTRYAKSVTVTSKDSRPLHAVWQKSYRSRQTPKCTMDKPVPQWLDRGMTERKLLVKSFCSTVEVRQRTWMLLRPSSSATVP